MEWHNIIGPILGMLGVPIGLLLGEYLRRQRRTEQFAAMIFTNRLEAYDGLLSVVNEGSSIAGEVIDNPELSQDERHTLISSAIGLVAAHANQKALYIDGELGAHCTALFMGIEDLAALSENEQTSFLTNYYKQLREAKRMIAEDAGVAQINKLFQDINSPRITSPVIDRIRELKHIQGD